MTPVEIPPRLFLAAEGIWEAPAPWDTFFAEHGTGAGGDYAMSVRTVPRAEMSYETFVERFHRGRHRREPVAGETLRWLQMAPTPAELMWSHGGFGSGRVDGHRSCLEAWSCLEDVGVDAGRLLAAGADSRAVARWMHTLAGWFESHDWLGELLGDEALAPIERREILEHDGNDTWVVLQTATVTWGWAFQTS